MAYSSKRKQARNPPAKTEVPVAPTATTPKTTPLAPQSTSRTAVLRASIKVSARKQASVKRHKKRGVILNLLLASVFTIAPANDLNIASSHDNSSENAKSDLTSMTCTQMSDTLRDIATRAITDSFDTTATNYTDAKQQTQIALRATFDAIAPNRAGSFIANTDKFIAARDQIAQIRKERILADCPSMSGDEIADYTMARDVHLFMQANPNTHIARMSFNGEIKNYTCDDMASAEETSAVNVINKVLDTIEVGSGSDQNQKQAIGELLFAFELSTAIHISDLEPYSDTIITARDNIQSLKAAQMLTSCPAPY